ncbi:hypothetical protein M758_11G049600 [Ceratodon purpureus]|nr:hypothetical protein M758_11G049600 [Ceratodon purpureus]
MIHWLFGLIFEECGGCVGAVNRGFVGGLWLRAIWQDDVFSGMALGFRCLERVLTHLSSVVEILLVGMVASAMPITGNYGTEVITEGARESFLWNFSFDPSTADCFDIRGL